MKKIPLLLLIIICSKNIYAQGSFREDEKFKGWYEHLDKNTNTYISESDWKKYYGKEIADSLKNDLKLWKDKNKTIDENKVRQMVESGDDLYGSHDVKKSINEQKPDSTNNFHIMEGGVIWKRVYETELSIHDIKSHFTKSGFLILSKEDSTHLVMSINKLSLNTKRFYTWAETTIYIREPMSASVLIELREGRYRISLSNIVFSSTSNVGLSFGGIYTNTNANNQTTLDAYAYNFKKNCFKGIFKSTTSEQLGTILYDLFLIKSIPEGDENW